MLVSNRKLINVKTLLFTALILSGKNTEMLQLILFSLLTIFLISRKRRRERRLFRPARDGQVLLGGVHPPAPAGRRRRGRQRGRHPVRPPHRLHPRPSPGYPQHCHGTGGDVPKTAATQFTGVINILIIRSFRVFKINCLVGSDHL